ncbi:MAG: hypothetical protein M5U07_09960 [Xanthobacteraceae bacterium]|nr:hypothetical protein [Xanthobacteraceae bacterium]
MDHVELIERIDLSGPEGIYRGRSWPTDTSSTSVPGLSPTSRSMDRVTGTFPVESETTPIFFPFRPFSVLMGLASGTMICQL